MVVRCAVMMNVVCLFICSFADLTIDAYVCLRVFVVHMAVDACMHSSENFLLQCFFGIALNS